MNYTIHKWKKIQYLTLYNFIFQIVELEISMNYTILKWKKKSNILP